MIITLVRFLRGYLRISISGNSVERFFNGCIHKKIYLWDIEQKESRYELNIYIQDYFRIKKLLKKTDTKTEIIKKTGLPFILNHYRKRKIFFFGFILCILIIVLLSSLLWEIDLVGNIAYSDEMLLESLEKSGIKTGIPIRNINCQKINTQLREQYDGIIWVSTSIDGSKLTIQIKENEDSISDKENMFLNTPKASDIVASEDCVISHMTIRTGFPLVKEGENVKKGDVIISGQIPIYNDAKEIINYKYCHSDADIIGKTELSYHDEIETISMSKKKTTIKKTEYYLKIRDYRITFGSLKNNYDYHELESKDYSFRTFSCGERIIIPYQPIKKIYTDTQIRKILSSDFQYHCKELEKKGVVILQNDVKIYRESDKACAKGTLIVEKNIGKPNISTLYPIPENNKQSGELINGNDGSNN